MQRKGSTPSEMQEEPGLESPNRAHNLQPPEAPAPGKQCNTGGSNGLQPASRGSGFNLGKMQPGPLQQQQEETLTVGNVQAMSAVIVTYVSKRLDQEEEKNANLFISSLHHELQSSQDPQAMSRASYLDTPVQEGE